MMKLGYVIVYTTDVLAAVEFYERAFGLVRRFVAEGNDYGEVDTGTTTLAFAHNKMAGLNKLTIRPNARGEASPGVELAFVTDDVVAGFERAVAAGAEAVTAPEVKPWGQTVAYVRDLDGVLVEVCSPMG